MTQEIIQEPDYDTKVLDHGYVRLIDYMGDDLSVVRAARVSYNAAWRAGKDAGSDHRLINYLWKNYHTSPFEACTFTFEVYAPIFVLRQWQRHRTQSYNELSARYKPLPEVYYVPNIDVVGIQSTSNKQGRQTIEQVSRTIQLDKFDEHCSAAFKLYNELLADNWPRELARCVLPLGTYSHMFTTMNLLNFLKFATLRCDLHAQHEIRVYANAMVELVRPLVPQCIGVWESNR